ncbi:MAG: hypothetical protein HEEMFOPI_00194 [Holosporales bacterium]
MTWHEAKNAFKKHHKSNRHEHAIYHEIDYLLEKKIPLSASDLYAFSKWANTVDAFVLTNNLIDLDRILYIFSYVYSHHIEAHDLIQNILQTKPKLIGILLLKSYESLDRLSPKKLNILLKGLEILKIEIPQKWITKWEESSRQLFDQFSNLDFIYLFDTYLSLNTFHSREWLSQWFHKTHDLLDFLSLEEFEKITRVLCKKEAFIPKYWLLKWAFLSVRYVPSTNINMISFYLSFLQKFPKIDEDVYIKILKRFEDSLSTSSILEISYNLKMFSKINCTMREDILQKIFHKALEERGVLNFEIISNFLLASALLNLNLKKLTPRLFDCIIDFIKSHSFKAQEKLDTAYSLILIKSYYQILNQIDFPITFENEETILKQLDERSDKKISLTQLEEFKLKTESQKGYMEYWIPEIASHVDIYLPESNTIIEINGVSHYQNDLLNPKSRLKTKILEGLGYNVSNVSVKDRNS